MPFFGNDMLRTGGIGEFTGGGLDGLRAITRAGWRAEDHALSLGALTTHIVNREIVNAEIPIGGRAGCSHTYHGSPWIC
ncbi:MAG TPA: hypothetical protein VFY84_19960 [Jiangellales bacterium]|nr:hypothetical protein [Jiangellales bacterium]